MAIINSELVFYKSSVVSDDDTNGGRKSTNQIQNNSSQNVFGNVFSAERLSGSTKYRKIFMNVANTDNTAFEGVFSYLYDVTPGDSYLCFFVGDATDTQAQITGSETKYGTGELLTDALVGSSTLVVNVENSSLATGNDAIYKDGGNITITNKSEYSSATGTVENFVIQGTPSVANDTEVTITISGTLANDYTALDTPTTKIQSYPDTVSISGSIDNWETSGINNTTVDQGAVYVDNIGCIEDTVTVTMTTTTTFSAVSTYGVDLGTGNIGIEFAPENSDFSRPYFTIPASTIAGSPAIGDEFSFDTHGADLAIWEKRVIPANCGSLAGDNVGLLVGGESA